MQYPEFVQRVQDLANLDAAAAERAMHATLSTLGETLYRTEQDDLGAQLSKDLRALLSERDTPEANRQRVDRLDVETFYNRVKARTDLGYQQAVQQARAVMAVLHQAVGDGAWQKLRAQFPAEYNDLLAPSDLDRQTLTSGPRRRDGS
jgi:uncharacterized protein (DUF2267 family)